MSVLRNLESKLAGLVEGTFSRAFKSEVRPVEIARKLAREMEEHKVQSLSRIYVPNEYAVCLSPEDREQFEGYEDELRSELSGYLLEHARRERIALLTRPQIEFNTDERLRLGRVRHPGAARAARARGGRARPSQGDEGHTMVYSASEPARRAAARARPRGAARARLRVDGRTERARLRRRACSGARATATSCSTTPTSRAATPRSGRRGGSWIVRDLGSTNGVKVNGRRIQRPAVAQARRRDRARHRRASTFELE